MNSKDNTVLNYVFENAKVVHKNVVSSIQILVWMKNIANV